MQKSTKQQLKADMNRLTAQHERYALAARAATHDRARQRHTRTLARLEDEILGLQEAIDALDGPLKVSTGEFRPVLPAMGALVEPSAARVAAPVPPRRPAVTLGSIATKLPPPPGSRSRRAIPLAVPEPAPEPAPDYTPVLSTKPPKTPARPSPSSEDPDADAFDAVLLRRRITLQAAKVMTSAFAIGFVVAAIAVWTATDDARAEAPAVPTVAKSAQ